MRKNILLTTAALILALGLTGCGSENEKSKDNDKDTKKVEKSTEESGGTEESSTVSDKKEPASILDEYLKNFNPTYELSDVKADKYWFLNENITFNSTVDTLENTKSYSASVYNETFEDESEVSFSDWNSLKDVYTENSSGSIGVTFTDDSSVTISHEGAYDLDEFHNILGTSRQATSYNEILGCNSFHITKSLSGADDISEYLNVKLDKDAGIGEQLISLKDEWNEPSMVAYYKASYDTITVAFADICWCFGDTNITFNIMDTNGELYLNEISFYWCDYDTMLTTLLDSYYNDYERLVDAPPYKEEPTTETVVEEPLPQCEPNLPEQVILTYGDKSTPIFGKSSNDIYNALGLVAGEDYTPATYSGTAEFNTFFYLPTRLECMSIDEKIYGDVYKIWSIDIDYVVGINMPEISLLGVKAGDTPRDFYQILGTCEDVSELDMVGEKDCTYYRYNLTIEGIQMKVTICTTDENYDNIERVESIRIDEISYN